MSREGKLAKNTIILSLGTFLPKLASFVTLPVLTDCMTKDEYGTYDLIIVLVSLFLPAITLQIQTAAFRFLIDERDKEENIKSIISNILVFIIPISLAGLTVLFFCMNKISIEIRIMIGLYFFFDVIVNALRQVARGLSKNINYSISAIISSGLQLILVIIFVMYLKSSLFGAIISLFLAEFISALYLFFSAKIYKYIDFRVVSRKEIKRLIAYSWPMVPNSISMWVMRMSDRLVLTFFMGVSANAVYAVANKIPQLLTLAQTTFTMAWQENASIVSKDEDAPKYYSSMFRMLFDLMAGAMSIIIALTPILFKVLVKGSYDEAYIQIPILLLGMLFFALSSYIGGIYVAYMKTTSVGITTFVSAIINLVIDLALVKVIGLYAASLSTLISYIFLFFYRLIDVKKIVPLKYDKLHMVIVFICMLVSCGVCMIQNIYCDILNCILSVFIFIAFNRNFISLITKAVMSKLKRR